MRTNHNQPKAQDATYRPGYILASLLIPALCTACLGTKPLQGGKALTTTSQLAGLTQTLSQGQNAAQPSKQDQHTIHTRSYGPTSFRATAPTPPQTNPSPS